MEAVGRNNRTQPHQRVALSHRQKYPTLFLVCAVFSIALLNPLLCILHCQIALVFQQQHVHTQHSGGFFCDLALEHAVGAQDQLQSDLPQASTPRAVHDAIQPSVLPIGLLGSVYLGLVRLPERLHTQLASPPLLPPPRYSI